MIPSRARIRANQRGTISTVEAIMLVAMTAIAVAIIVPSYTAMQNRSHDSEARANVRQAVDAVEAFHADRGTYAGLAQPALRRYEPSLGPGKYRLEQVNEKAYCVESTSDGRTWHLEGPAGDVGRGHCP